MIPLNKPGRLNVSSSGGDYLANHFKHRKAIFLSTASDALNAIYRRLYEEKGSMRIGVSPLTCFQAIYPIVTNGHIPVFLDVDPNTFNIDARKLSKHDDIQSLAVIHLGGNPNEMDVIDEYAHERGIIVIEDCAQALGSTYDGQYLGNFGDYAAFSLIKNLHVPAGGVLLSTADMSDYVEKAASSGILLKQYRNVKIWLESKANHKPGNVWNWLYGGLMGLKKYSVPISDKCHTLNKKEIHEALFRLDTFDALFRQRLSNAERIISEIDSSWATVQRVPEKGFSNRNRVMFRLKNRNAYDVIKALRNKGIAANNLTQNYICGFQPHVSKDVLLGRYYQQQLEVYEGVFRELIAVPSSPFLTNEEIEYISHCMNEIIS